MHHSHRSTAGKEARVQGGHRERPRPLYMEQLGGYLVPLRRHHHLPGRGVAHRRDQAALRRSHAPGEGLGLKVKKVEDKAGEIGDCMVVVGFTHKNTAFEAKGVRPGDVVVAVQSMPVLELPYAAAMAKVAEATKSGGLVSLTFLSLCSYSLMVAEEDARSFLRPFDRAIRSLLPHRWDLVKTHRGFRLCVESTDREVLRQWQGLVGCAKEGGFFTVPLHLEGTVRDEKALTEIEAATHTTISMQVRKDLKLIVVLVLPDRTGKLGNVSEAVRRVKSLQSVPCQQHFVQGKVYLVQNAGRGGCTGNSARGLTCDQPSSLLSLHEPRHQPKHVFAAGSRNDDRGGTGGKKKKEPNRDGCTQTEQTGEKGAKPGKKGKIDAKTGMGKIGGKDRKKNCS